MATTIHVTLQDGRFETIKRIRVEKVDTFGFFTFQRSLLQLFPVLKTSYHLFYIHYVDEDDDEITISNDSEFLEAIDVLSAVSKKEMKFKISRRSLRGNGQRQDKNRDTEFSLLYIHKQLKEYQEPMRFRSLKIDVENILSNKNERDVLLQVLLMPTFLNTVNEVNRNVQKRCNLNRIIAVLMASEQLPELTVQFLLRCPNSLEQSSKLLISLGIIKDANILRNSSPLAKKTPDQEDIVDVLANLLCNSTTRVVDLSSLVALITGNSSPDLSNLPPRVVDEVIFNLGISQSDLSKLSQPDRMRLLKEVDRRNREAMIFEQKAAAEKAAAEKAAAEKAAAEKAAAEKAAAEKAAAEKAAAEKVAAEKVAAEKAAAEKAMAAELVAKDQQTIIVEEVSAPIPVEKEVEPIQVDSAPRPRPPAIDEDSLTFEAAFVGDVTSPDGTAFVPGQEFIKTWRMKNTGQHNWPSDCCLLRVGGDVLREGDCISVAPITSGETLDVSLEFQAPTKPGRYISYWRLGRKKSPEKRFGHRVWVDFVVIPHSPQPQTSAVKGAEQNIPAQDLEAKESNTVSVPAPTPICQSKPSNSESVYVPAPTMVEDKPKTSTLSYEAQMRELNIMGFGDAEKNQELLKKYEGDVSKVINALLG